MVNPLWTARRRRLVERFIESAQKKLRLVDWEIILNFDDDIVDGSAYATITRQTDQRRAVVRFGAREFLNCTAAHQRQTLVHELLHCHLFDLHEAGELAVEAVDGPAHRATLSSLLTSRNEQATDNLADAFVALLADQPVPATDAPLRVSELLVKVDDAAADLAAARPGPVGLVTEAAKAR